MCTWVIDEDGNKVKNDCHMCNCGVSSEHGKHNEYQGKCTMCGKDM
jgi:hypothetical protein